MFGHSMGNLMAEDDGEGWLVLCDGQETFINYNLTTGHTECVDSIVLHKIEFPVEVLQFVGESVFTQISFDRSGKALSDTLDKGCGVSVG